MEDVYELFHTRHGAARVAGTTPGDDPPHSRARPRARQDLDPRGARAGAVPRASATRRRAEFEAVIDRAPTNDYALFCLGRSLQMLGRHAEARKPLALAAQLRPGRRDYRLYRDRARARAGDDSEDDESTEE